MDLTREYLEFSLKAAGVKPGMLKGMKSGTRCVPRLGWAGDLPGAGTGGGTGAYLAIDPGWAFPTGSPNPTSQGKMDGAVALCKKIKGDVVIGVDGDGDRMVFGDKRGILTAGFVTVPVLKSAGVGGHGKARGKKGPESVLYDPKVSPLALAEWGKLGVQPVLFRNGHSQIKDYMRQISAPAAAEESGHYYHQITMGKLSVWSENSIMTVLFFLKALAQDRGLMDQLWALQNQVFTRASLIMNLPTMWCVIRRWQQWCVIL
ncbi:MAG: hypothetical protein HC898_01540 [Phycisphaerales bacterium]|nr:hypothetical protein [Phycisphaerales bacterium]